MFTFSRCLSMYLWFNIMGKVSKSSRSSPLYPGIIPRQWHFLTLHRCTANYCRTHRKLIWGWGACSNIKGTLSTFVSPSTSSRTCFISRMVFKLPVSRYKVSGHEILSGYCILVLNHKRLVFTPFLHGHGIEDNLFTFFNSLKRKMSTVVFKNSSFQKLQAFLVCHVAFVY